ncbi:MAG: hypothetical protein FJ197_00895 [Gammaproteobacteria bacterium]|nr:hypothetical protein [Gammaproteobacteria bacterium]
MAYISQRDAVAGLTHGASHLLALALRAEREPGAWRSRYARLLEHPAIVAPPGSGASAPLAEAGIAGQYALRFPQVSGDSDWLRQRSMVVMARRLAPLLARGASVAVDLTRLSRGDACADTRRDQMRDVVAGFAQALPAALGGFGVSAGRLVLSAEADHPGLGELLRLRAAGQPERPRIVLRLTDRLFQAIGTARSGAASTDALGRWQGLTTLAQREPGVHLVLPETTRSACTLASGERADAVLPGSLFEARTETAWIAFGLQLDRLAARDMAGALAELRDLLCALLRFADNLVDQLDWPSPELGQDALVNRRLALHVTGIGALADRWSLDPGNFASVELLLRWLGIVRRLVVRESNALARERGPFPGLELRQLTRSLTRTLGEERAGRALRRAGLRHRHLLVLSPYDVFPGSAPRRPQAAYLHLLPAIRLADTIAMHGDGVARALPPQVFRRLIHQSWVIARNRP